MKLKLIVLCALVACAGHPLHVEVMQAPQPHETHEVQSEKMGALGGIPGGGFVPPTRLSTGGGGGGGDITDVTAGTGLTGGAMSGNATINVGCSTGLTCAADSVSVDTAAIQARITGTCPAGQSIRVISSTGTVTCEVDDTGIAGTGTINTLMMWTGTGTAGDSPLVYDGSTTVMTSKDLKSTTGNLVAGGSNSVVLIGDGTTRYLKLAPTATVNWIESGSSSTTGSALALAFGSMNGSAQWGKFDASGNFQTFFNTTIGDDASDLATVKGSAFGQLDDTYFAWDGSKRLGFTKKAANSPKLTYGGLTFAIASSSGSDIAASNTFTDRLTIDSSGNVTIPTGTLAMGAHKITGLANGTASSDAAAFGQIGSAINTAVSGTAGQVAVFTGANAVGTGPITVALDMNSHQIHSVTDGTGAQDAATVAQLTAATTGAIRTTPTCTLTLATGNNDDVPLPACTSNYYRVALSGTTTLRGLDSTGVVDGQVAFLDFAPGFNVSVANNSSGSTTTNRILTNPNATTVLANVSSGAGALEMCTYNGGSVQRWYCQNIGGNRFASLTVDGASTLTGAVTASNTLGVTGALTASGGATVTGADLVVGANKLTVDDATGNASTAGTLGVAGLVDFTGQSVYLGRRVLTSTTTATYTPTTGTREVLLRMCGAGGGSGGAKGSASGGAAAGSYIEKWINPGAAITGGSYTDGLGGSAGAATPTDGGTGGDTTITIQGVLYTAKGGLKSLAATGSYNAGGAGQGGSTAADVTTIGAPGGFGASTSGTNGASGAGGSSAFGAGGVGVVYASNNVPGVAGSGYCSGAGGAAGNSGAAGAVGAQGVIIIDEWR